MIVLTLSLIMMFSISDSDFFSLFAIIRLQLAKKKPSSSSSSAKKTNNRRKNRQKNGIKNLFFTVNNVDIQLLTSTFDRHALPLLHHRTHKHVPALLRPIGIHRPPRVWQCPEHKSTDRVSANKKKNILYIESNGIVINHKGETI